MCFTKIKNEISFSFNKKLLKKTWLDEWEDVIQEIDVSEKLTFKMRLENLKEIFYHSNKF